MDGTPQSGAPGETRNDATAADGGLAGIGTATYATLAARLLDNGYEPLPILRGTKRPAPSRWAGVAIDEARVEEWSRAFATAGTGLRTGRLVAVDIDLEDPDRAYAVASCAGSVLGETLVRVGRWPRRLLIYRTRMPIRKMSVAGVEVLGAGQQFVAFARHPLTDRPYEWVTGDTPCDVPLDHLPLVDEGALQRFLVEAAALAGPISGPHPDWHPRPHHAPRGAGQTGPIRNADGLVVDGRDGWLSTIAFHEVHEALAQSATLDPTALVQRVWDRFCVTTDVSRARQEGGRCWSPADALRKVRDKLSLHAAGRLPGRSAPDLHPDDLGELLSPAEARTRLSRAIDAALRAATAWWSGARDTSPPMSGIRATVGLGKSAISRDRVADWQRMMAAQGMPHRVLVLTPSHALAEEAAPEWRTNVAGTDGGTAAMTVAVLRGYEGTDPATGAPMCQDHEMVKTALREGISVGGKVCYSSPTWQCPQYGGCLKQQNKRDVASADVVLAPYDALFTGPAAGDGFGLIVIDEGCWQRAVDDLRAPPLEVLSSVGLSSSLAPSDPEANGWVADLDALRRQVAAALDANGSGRVRAAALSSAGLSACLCEEAARTEERGIRDPGIYAGMKHRQRKAAVAIVKRNEIARRMAALCRALASLLRNEATAPVLRIDAPNLESGRRGITLHGHRRIAAVLEGIPILHIDATLRPDLARVLLPSVSVERIEAVQAHQSLTLVVGNLGKSNLCVTPDLAPEEGLRRQNRLREVIDHVRWQATRVAPGRTLVVTYKAIEAAFRDIPGVDTGHFNAIAGLDQFRDVALLIVIGRPLPASEELATLCASLFGHLPEGRYQPERRAVHLRAGGHAALRTLAHPDPQAELLRAAVCDDEVIQAIGRGRGVNRTADNPLEVQVLADVALPLVHDRVSAWSIVKPDIVQRMLLAGAAVDSPTDAAELHPAIFASVDQAKKTFERSGFKGQNPIGNSYREMTLKSARYRRGGRGRAWQSCWWLAGDAADIRDRLEATLGPLGEWLPG